MKSTKHGFVVNCKKLDFLVAGVTYVNTVIQRLVLFWPFFMKLLSRNPAADDFAHGFVLVSFEA